MGASVGSSISLLDRGESVGVIYLLIMHEDARMGLDSSMLEGRWSCIAGLE